MSISHDLCWGRLRVGLRPLTLYPTITCGALVVCCALAAAGCGMDSRHGDRGGHKSGENDHKIHFQGTLDSWRGPFVQVPLAIRVAVKDLGWGLLKAKDIAGHTAPGIAPAPSLRVEADLLLPDGRTAKVIAWPEVSGERHLVRISVRAGHFGDSAVERRFIKRCKALATGKPLIPRAATFQLPDPIEPHGATPAAKTPP